MEEIKINSKELLKDFQTIKVLQEKYMTKLKKHMSLKKYERKESWNKERNILFHLCGALSMARNGFSAYI